MRLQPRVGSRQKGRRFACLAVCVIGGATVVVPADPLAAAGQPQAPAQAAVATMPPGRPHSFSVQAGADWLGGMPLGTGLAALTPNDRTAANPLTLFSSEGRRQATPALGLRLGFRLTSSLAVEAGFGYSRPGVQVTIRNDYEQAASVRFAGNQLGQYVIDAAFVVHVPRWAFSRKRATPFILAGAGYLRQVHDGNAAIETGQVAFGGGGVQYLFSTRRRGLLTGIALRADLRVCYQRDGFSFDNAGRAFPVAGASLVFAF